jgi:hypothetical protein
MSRLDPQKLHVSFHAGTSPSILEFPRRYTLTHSDMTGDLFLSIGAKYDRKQIAGIYTRLMRDEVLAEWKNDGDQAALHVYVHVSGGIAFGFAFWRNEILHYHMPMVLEACRYGDREIFQSHPTLDEASVFVHFASHRKRYNRVEDWGQIRKYKVDVGRSPETS